MCTPMAMQNFRDAAEHSSLSKSSPAHQIPLMIQHVLKSDVKVHTAPYYAATSQSTPLHENSAQ